MTREEAIKILEIKRDCMDYEGFSCDMPYGKEIDGFDGCRLCEKALDMAIVALQERPLQPPFKLKTLADSTLMSMTKAELIEYARMCEKNAENAYAQIDQQAKNVKKLLDEQERPKGRWEKFGYKWKCSECDGKINIDGTPKENGLNFCPNCGADMRESEQHV